MVGESIYGVGDKIFLLITFGRKALTLTAQVICGNSRDAVGLADLSWTNAIIASFS